MIIQFYQLGELSSSAAQSNLYDKRLFVMFLASLDHRMDSRMGEWGPLLFLVDPDTEV